VPVEQAGTGPHQDGWVPVELSDGTLYGTFCAAGLTSDNDLSERDAALTEVLASAASVIVEPRVREHARRSEIEDRLAPVMAAGGPVVALQPIVDLATVLRHLGVDCGQGWLCGRPAVPVAPETACPQPAVASA
jgi:hypothetical protein